MNIEQRISNLEVRYSSFDILFSCLGAPYAEQTIVNSGKQSMPFEYLNDGSTDKAFYSETELALSGARSSDATIQLRRMNIE